MSFEANCHCGAVAVTVDAETPTEALMCNCSHCSIKSLVLAAVPGDAVTVSRGEDQLKTYQFNRKVINHRFCSNCGVQPFAQGKGADGSSMAMINMRCVQDVEIDKLQITHFDGASR